MIAIDAVIRKFAASWPRGFWTNVCRWSASFSSWSGSEQGVPGYFDFLLLLGFDMIEQGKFDPARLVFIDETAASTNMVRLRGRAPRGVRLIGRVPLGAPLNEKIRLPGTTAKTMLDMVVDGFAALGAATPHGRIVCGRLAETLSGGMTDITEVLSEDDLSILERQAFMSLVQTEATRDCIDHM